MITELRKKTVKQLRELAKEQGIVGRWNMNKDELIEELFLFAHDKNYDNAQMIQPEGNVNVTKGTDDYVNRLEIGTLVAFNVGNNVVLSGKYVGHPLSKDSWDDDYEDESLFIVETKRGTKFTIEAKDIVWVRTGERWPKWVFELFSKNPMGGANIGK